MATAARMIGEGATDAAIGTALGVGRMAASRHRAAHVLAPARAVVAAAAKDQLAIEKRAAISAAVEAGDPSAWVGLHAIIGDLQSVYQRLDRAATEAETDKQRLALASLSGQQLKAMDVRARLGGVGGYARPDAPGCSGAAPVSISINFSGGQVETFTAMPTATVIDADGCGAAVNYDLSSPPAGPVAPPAPFDDRAAARLRLARAFQTR